MSRGGERSEASAVCRALLLACLAACSGGESEPKLAINAQVAGEETEQTGFETASAPELTAICDEYWDFLATGAGDEPPSGEPNERQERYARAANELTKRGAEVLQWARARLKHAGYEARELAAFMIGELAKRGQLGADASAIVAELSELAVRPIDQQNKEAQANGAAIDALLKIGDKAAIPALREVLTSEDWNGDDIQYLAAEALGSIVGVRFMDREDPVAAAREWLRANP